jgi:hypothetical protein
VQGIDGQTETVVNSSLAAYAMGKVTLRNVLEDNGGGAFGVAAHTIKSLTRIEGDTVYKHPDPWPVEDGDFEVRLV